MKKFVEEFKKFALGSNVLELATAVIMGGAAGKMVSALVDSVLMPIIGMLLGGRDFSSLVLTVGDASIKYGNFIQAVIDFLIISLFVFFMMKGANAITKPKKEEKPKSEDYLKEIRDILKEQK